MGTVEEPAFSSVAIVGLGLIGGSLALAIRERWPEVRIVGLDRPPVLAHAIGSGAIDRAARDLSDLGNPSLVVLAAPVRENVRMLSELASVELGSAILTDVGGTKRDIVESARILPIGSRFVGGHPLGGAERGGFGFARPDLFVGRPWILTPHDSAPAAVVERLCNWVSGLGSKPSTMDAGQHDQLMAFLSHWPQLATSTLMEVIGEATGPEGLRLAGRGLRDTTRLASSPAEVWHDITLTNPDDIGHALDLLIARLQAVRADLGRGTVLDEVFERAARWRAELTKTGGA